MAHGHNRCKIKVTIMPQSWGRYFKYDHHIISPSWLTDLSELNANGDLWLPYGLGRSYGDSCLNQDHTLVTTTNLNRLISADWHKGEVKCQAGMSLDQLLQVIVPRGYFVPVTPGTKYITLGGAVANDIHGKNHHLEGTFGCHISSFGLWRSGEGHLECSREQNPELFAATIGGLGLTGLITWVTLRLKPISSAMIDTETIKFNSLDEFLSLNQESQAYTYSVAWFDCLHETDRGHFIRGNHSQQDGPLTPHKDPKLTVPCNLPGFLLNPLSMKLFNKAYYSRLRANAITAVQHYDPFFYPLDMIHQWNRIYGTSGFFQYQFVLPFAAAQACKEVLAKIRASRQGSFLAVLKAFGDRPSPGLLSFPIPGITLTLDFPNRGAKTLNLLKELEPIILAGGGRFYPAKDSMMSPKAFQASCPQLNAFLPHVDPQMSSSFWRRVNPENTTQQ